MTIRFLQTCASEVRGVPFMAGQVITTTAPSAFLLTLVDGVRAEAVKAEDERAVAVEAETPEPKKRGRKRARS